MTLNTQLVTMIAMMLSGIYLGFATETFRRVAIHWKNNVYLKYAFEIIFWIVQTCLLFIVLYKVNEAEIRMYVFLACALGFSMYMVLFQATYRKLLELSIRITKSVIRWMLRLVHYTMIKPIVWVFRTLIIILLFVFEMLKKTVLLIGKILLYPVLLLLKWIIPQKVRKKITNLTTFCSTIVDKQKKWVKRVFFKRR